MLQNVTIIRNTSNVFVISLQVFLEFRNFGIFREYITCYVMKTDRICYYVMGRCVYVA